MVIFKYSMTLAIGERNLQLPQNSHILRVDVQNGAFCAWVLVPTPVPKATEDVVFSIYGTGQEFEERPLVYLNTILMHNCGIVVHVFVKLEGTISASAGHCYGLSRTKAD